MIRPPATDFWQVGIVPAPIATLLDPGALAALRERIVWLPEDWRVHEIFGLMANV